MQRLTNSLQQAESDVAKVKEDADKEKRQVGVMIILYKTIKSYYYYYMTIDIIHIIIHIFYIKIIMHD